MSAESRFDRRSFIKWMNGLPLLGYFAAQGMMEKASAAVKRSSKDNVYARLGVRPMINARGTWTYLSGSLELPEVRAAKQEAALHFVDMWELQHAVGKRLAELSGAESGMVTSGAAGAMGVATAACIAGTDPAKIWQLPDTTGLKHEVIMFGGRVSFDSMIRAAGGKLVLAFSHDELQSAINDKTAMVYSYNARGENLEKALAITKKAGVPFMVDHAAGIPPIENLTLYSKMGADLYTFSGGKGLCGPQCTGLLLGRKDLIEAALANTCPWEGSVTRGMKVGKEEIIGCLTAVETWVKRDMNAVNDQWNRWIKRVQQAVDTVPGVKTTIQSARPVLAVDWDQAAWKFTAADCVKAMREGEPRIEVLWSNNPSILPVVREGASSRPGADAVQRSQDGPKAPARPITGIRVDSQTLQPGEELIVGRRLRDVLNQARKAANA